MLFTRQLCSLKRRPRLHLMMSLMSNRSASTITSTTPFNITLSHDDKKYNQLKKSNNCVKFFSSTDDAAPSSNDSAADANKTSSVNNNTKTRTSLPNETNVCIVGGGIIGTSVAYHLAKLGVEDVILLERDTLTSGTTWHAAGLINTFGSLSGTSTSMRMYTKELYKDILPEETSMDTGFLPVGFIELACDNDRLEYYRRVANFNRFCGIKVEEITPEQVKEKFPLIETNDVLAGFYVEDDGRVNPYDATMALAKGAKKFGAQIYENTFVSGITKSRSTRNNNIKQLIPKVTGVILESGEEIKANVVVNCAGMWARQFGEKCGVSVPNQAAEHYYLITDQMDSVDPSWPVVEDSSKCVYIRPEGGGLMLGLFESTGAPWNVQEIPNDFSYGEIEPDWDRMGPYIEDAMNRVPETLVTGAKKFFCGPESFTPDGSPIVGEAPELQNYFVAAGLNSIGILTGGGIGKLVAEWIREKRPPSDIDITGINIDRFHKHQSNPKYRADRVGEILGETYKVHFPDHNLKTCRNVKTTVLHDRLKKQNAHFRDVSGWESPSWYAPIGITPIIEQESFGKQSFFSYWESEHLACRKNVALFDVSFMSKFLVQGDDAGTFLNHLSTANVNGNCGTIAYTQWLNEQGYMEADLTVTKIEDDKFLVVATDTMQNHVLTHMKRRLSNDSHVFITDVTSSFVQLNIQGPNSRKLLQSLTSYDLSDFSFRSAAEIDIGYARVLCTRITYVGELGYELFIPVEFALHVYDSILMQGTNYELKHAGLRALGSLRMEKAYRDYGHDMDNTDTLLECGLGFTCSFEKDGGFIGIDHVLSQKNKQHEEGGLRKRMVQVLLRNSEYMLHHGEVIHRNGKAISEIRAASYGHSLGGAVGLTMLESVEPINKTFISEGEWEISIGNELIPCIVSLAPLYDPRNKRIKV